MCSCDKKLLPGLLLLSGEAMCVTLGCCRRTDGFRKAGDLKNRSTIRKGWAASFPMLASIADHVRCDEQRKCSTSHSLAQNMFQTCGSRGPTGP